MDAGNFWSAYQGVAPALSPLCHILVEIGHIPSLPAGRGFWPTLIFVKGGLPCLERFLLNGIPSAAVTVTVSEKRAFSGWPHFASLRRVGFFFLEIKPLARGGAALQRCISDC